MSIQEAWTVFMENRVIDEIKKELEWPKAKCMLLTWLE